MVAYDGATESREERKAQRQQVIDSFLERQKSRETQRQKSIEALKHKIFKAQTLSVAKKGAGAGAKSNESLAVHQAGKSRL